MPRPCRFVRLLTAALSAALLAAAPAPAPAQNLQSGDIIIPGDVYGGGGCFYRLRGGVATPLFESSSYGTPGDMVVDSQGRLVFFASPRPIRNYNDNALYRIDPANGALERLFYFPNIVQPGDTIPGGASAATGFGGPSAQSLHLESQLQVVIDDNQNGGWPQIQSRKSYGFGLSTAVPAGQAPTTYRYGADDGICETGISSALLPWPGATPYMAADGSSIYYGLNNVIGKTGAPAILEMHLDGDWGQFDASLPLPPKNELIITGHVFDNTRYPNGQAQCGPWIDYDVPFYGGGFSVLSMDGLGVLGGKPYITSNSVATGTPYVFDIAKRAPYLNVYVCFWDTATEGRGMLDWGLPDGTPTSCPLTSPDGGALLGLGNGVIKRVDANGNFELLDSSQPYTGRPWRWHGPSSLAVAAAAVPDSGAQVLVVRADALVNVLLTDGLGRRIGHDAAGNPVNDFGESGQVLALGAGGWPRLLALRDPMNGAFAAEVAATGAGDWSVKAYLAHEGGGGLIATTSGASGGAGSVVRGLHVGQPTELIWFADLAGAGEPGTTEGIGFVSVGPVPARGEVRLAYRVPGNGARVRLDIFDVAGRLVTTPVNGFATGGMHTLAWSGNGPSGARLAHGIYLASLDVNGRRETRRIVLTN